MSGKKRIVVGIGVAAAAMIMVAAVILMSNNNANSPARLLSLGEKYLTEMDYEQALVQFLKVIEIEPNNARAYAGAAEAYIGLGRTDEATAILRRGFDETGDVMLEDMLNQLAIDSGESANATSGDSSATTDSSSQDSSQDGNAETEPLSTAEPLPTTEPLTEQAQSLIDEIKAALRNRDTETVRTIMNRQEYIDYFSDSYNDDAGFNCWLDGVLFCDATKDAAGDWQNGAEYHAGFTLITDDSGDFGSYFTYAEITNGQYTGAAEHRTSFPDGSTQSHMQGTLKDGVFSGTYDYYAQDTGEIHLINKYIDGYGEIYFSKDDGITLGEQDEAYKPMGTASPND